MVSVGDNVSVVMGSDGKYYCKSSGTVSVGDQVQVFIGSDGKYYASKSGTPIVGSQVLVSMDSTGKYIAHISSTTISPAGCSEVQPDYEYAGWFGNSSVIWVAWYNDNGYSTDPTGTYPHTEMVFEARDPATFEPLTGICVIRICEEYAATYDIILGVLALAPITYRSPLFVGVDSDYLYDAYGKYGKNYPFTNVNAVDEWELGWGMGDYFAYYNPTADTSYYLYDRTYTQQYTADLSLGGGVTGTAVGDLDDFYAYEDQTNTIKRYAAGETTVLATSSAYPYLNLIYGRTPPPGILLLDDSLVFGLTFSEIFGLPTGGTRLNRNDLTVMDLIQS